MTRCSNGSPRAIQRCSHEAAQRVGVCRELASPYPPTGSTREHTPTLNPPTRLLDPPTSTSTTALEDEHDVRCDDTG